MRYFEQRKDHSEKFDVDVRYNMIVGFPDTFPKAIFPNGHYADDQMIECFPRQGENYFMII